MASFTFLVLALDWVVYFQHATWAAGFQSSKRERLRPTVQTVFKLLPESSLLLSHCSKQVRYPAQNLVRGDFKKIQIQAGVVHWAIIVTIYYTYIMLCILLPLPLNNTLVLHFVLLVLIFGIINN